VRAGRFASRPPTRAGLGLAELRATSDRTRLFLQDDFVLSVLRSAYQEHKAGDSALWWAIEAEYEALPKKPGARTGTASPEAVLRYLNMNSRW
jgi:hypothetical protein